MQVARDRYAQLYGPTAGDRIRLAGEGEAGPAGAEGRSGD